MWSSVGSNATVIPSVLIVAHLFEDEIVQLDDVRVLFDRILVKGRLNFTASTSLPSPQTGLQYHLCKQRDYGRPSYGRKASPLS
jgi:hypothetical protein